MNNSKVRQFIQSLGAPDLTALPECGDGGRPSSSARGSYVMGNRIIYDGMRFTV